MTTITKAGCDIMPGDQIQLESGAFVRVTDLVRAPVRIRYDDGSFAKGVRWAYLAGGGHAAIAAEDVVTVQL